MAAVGELVVRLEDTAEFLAWRRRQEAWQEKVEETLTAIASTMEPLEAGGLRIFVKELRAIRMLPE